MEYKPFDWQGLAPAPIIGVDEVGRGCLAGPVYAAAVILNTEQEFQFYTDSKMLSESRREQYSEHIKIHHRWSVGIASVEEITKYNILHAALLAMWRAVKGLKIDSGHVVVDGKFPIPKLPPSFCQTPLIKGDLRAHPVAAASIVAKVARDRWISEKDKEFPKYGFALHKGYATSVHRQAIKEWGPCSLHRPTFAGVKEHIVSTKRS